MKSNGECKLAIQGCGSKSQCPVPAAGFLRVKVCCFRTGRGAAVTEVTFASGVHHRGLVANREGSREGLQDGRGCLSMRGLCRSIYFA